MNLDLMMPKMGGKQSLDELVSIDPHVKVLITSGHFANGETKDAIESLAKGFVGKPYEMRALLETVRRILDS